MVVWSVSMVDGCCCNNWHITYYCGMMMVISRYVENSSTGLRFGRAKAFPCLCIDNNQ
jgi:hypothetical protein